MGDLEGTYLIWEMMLEDADGDMGFSEKDVKGPEFEFKDMSEKCYCKPNGC